MDPRSGAVVDDDGVTGGAEGVLCLAQSWPGAARGIDGDTRRFANTYFDAFPGRGYCTLDGARRDADGYYTITGRIDDGAY